MDQRRFISFLILSMAIYLLAMQIFHPPQPAKQAPAAGAPAKGKADAKGPAVAGEAKKDRQPAAANQQPPAPAGKLGDIKPVQAKDPFTTIGSLDPSDKNNYRMLVTLSSKGGAVVRAEMTNPRYRDQHDWSGYLGDLQLKDEPGGGVKVQVVGAGTPAASANLALGDVIVGMDTPEHKDIKTVGEFAAALARTTPEREITLLVRQGNNPPQPRTVQLMRRPFAVVRPEIENYRMRKVDPPADFVERPSFLLTLSKINDKDLDPADAKRLADVLEAGDWELNPEKDDELKPYKGKENVVTFRRTLDSLKLTIYKIYTLAMVPADQHDEVDYPAYDLRLDIKIKKTDNAAPTVAYRLDGPTGMPLEGWWYSSRVGSSSVRDVVGRCAQGKQIHLSNSNIAKGKAEPFEDATLVNAGVDGKYFSAVLVPQLDSLDDNRFESTQGVIVGTSPETRTPEFANVTCRLFRKSIDLAAAQVPTDSYDIFLGPKRPNLLEQYYPKSQKWPAGDANYSLRELIYYGWFGPVARVMLSILRFFYGIVHNYGLAIILLTLSVRGAMFPISYKQTKNMARIQALKPEMDKIAEKYKNDLQKKSQATQELYRKYKINPLGGCLPLFLQMPIFIGLYRALMMDVELRQSPLFGSAIHWCSNLAAPDMFLDWSGVMPAFLTQGVLGPYLNVLPIVTVTIMLITQKMTMPAPTTEQAAMQQKMMKYMMIFFALMFYKVASGLCLYLIVSSLWGIAERKLLPKAQTAGAGAAGGLPPDSGNKRPRGDSPNGSGGSKKSRKSKPKK